MIKSQFNKIKEFEKQTRLILPEEYKEFLQFSNGATLFKDIKYGQWGCKILGLDQLIKKKIEAKSWGYNLDTSWIIFATWFGDGDVLVFNLDKYNSSPNKYILDGEQGYKCCEWEYINGSFLTWLDRLIVAQGAKYWRWY